MNTDAPKVKKVNRTLIIICSGIIILSGVLSVSRSKRVYVPGLDQAPAPELCPVKVMWDRDCPGCGLARSLIHFGHGDLISSLEMHRIGPVFYLFICAQLLYQWWGWKQHQTGHPVSGRPKALEFAGTCLIALFICNWIYGLAYPA
ncbi:MAG: DUF2752 domain-containing protein [Planctomycetota bacterium]|jgi:hypothetical protein|nr:DUF2752 domain-containing protein [Planctomycetota bacterium]MDP7253041.1 DUF2752 domain-containing protein [Planctomycetota bacterium]